MRTTRAHAGFTLVEVMAALAILSIAMVVLIQSQTQSVHNVIRVSHYERAVYITENQLHWTYIDLNEAESWEEYAQASGEDGDFLWEVSLQPVESDNDKVVLLKMIATTRWQEGEKEAVFQLESRYLWGSPQ